ncbi:hypothetical protein swp_1018 [Shewanella piezotolerans WP3]|uniref:Uncharacterized protein n=1 Tax=Shewanella piezotolerans (strain WP3 / JCM 13877) TaxID=225849 RepID=B8CJ60_SHEPW|nr:hypothetical protein swp_1018 [Shewanella piezotolerans WP3]
MFATGYFAASAIERDIEATAATTGVYVERVQLESH